MLDLTVYLRVRMHTLFAMVIGKRSNNTRFLFDAYVVKTIGVQKSSETVRLKEGKVELPWKKKQIN